MNVLIPDSTASIPTTRFIPSIPEQPDQLMLAILRTNSRTHEEIQSARDRIFAASPLPMPLPEGKTIFDMVEGMWPGDETDEEIERWLEELS